MHQIADEAGLELNMELPANETSSIGTAATSTVAEEQDDLSRRLAKLRQG